MQRYLRAFVAGSSFLVVVWPFLYLGIPSILNPASGFSFEVAALVIPTFVGLLNILFVRIKGLLPFGPRGNYWVFGATHGLVFSLMGNFFSDIPKGLYTLEGNVSFLTIPIAVVLYAIIWRYVIRSLNRMVGVDE